MNRRELQRLAIARLRDAKTLLLARRWAGAYYLAGYSVECALKSCVIAHLMKTDEFPERRFSEQCWTHDLERLLALAGLNVEMAADMAANTNLSVNWKIVVDWDESSRYARSS